MTFLELCDIVRNHEGTIWDIRIIRRMMADACPCPGKQTISFFTDGRQEHIHLEWHFEVLGKHSFVSKTYLIRHLREYGFSQLTGDFHEVRREIISLIHRKEAEREITLQPQFKVFLPENFYNAQSPLQIKPFKP